MGSSSTKIAPSSIESSATYVADSNAELDATVGLDVEPTEKPTTSEQGGIMKALSERFLAVEKFVGRQFEEGNRIDAIRDVCKKPSSRKVFKEFLSSDAKGKRLIELVDFINVSEFVFIDDRTV